MTASIGGYGGSEVLMQSGRDMAVLTAGSAPALCRVDEHGWLVLSGETGADFNLAAVARSCPPAVLDGYVDEIEGRGLDAILMVDDGAPQLVEGATARGLTPAGRVPVMVWHERPRLAPARPNTVRRAAERDMPAVGAALAETFELAEATVRRAMLPSPDSAGADVWVVDAEGMVAGSGTFIRSGGHVGIYGMATRPRFQRQGIGRAVLHTAMSYYLDGGVTTFTLEATAAGLRLYEQSGFETVAEPYVFVIGASAQFSA